MTNIKIFAKFLVFLFLINTNLFAQTNKTPEKIHWYSFEDVVKQEAIKPKKVFMDIFTDWCGWCKVLDKSTFTNPVIIKKMNQYFYACKLNAERKDTIWFRGYPYVNPNPSVAQSTNQLAASILKGRMSYPSMVYFNDSMQIITTVQSYLKPSQLEPILVYIGEDKFKTMTYDSFRLKYKTESNDDWVDPTKPVIMKTVTFDSAKTTLKVNTYPQLDSVATVLKANTEMKIEIDSYTDNTGDVVANKTLSEMRAKTVFDYIVAKGIEATRMSYAGFGSLNPIADNTTAMGRKINNRIEIKVK